MWIECRLDADRCASADSPLFGDMDNYTPVNLDVKCLCCDICYKSCQCGACESNLNMFSTFS